MLTDVSDDKVQHIHTNTTLWDVVQAYTAASMTVANILNSVLVQDQDLFDEITDLEQM
jgi:hypothetical protein